MKTTVRIITQDREIPKQGPTHKLEEGTAKLFRADGTATKKGSELLKLILNRAFEAQQKVDKGGRNIQEITVWIIAGAQGIPGLVEK